MDKLVSMENLGAQQEEYVKNVVSKLMMFQVRKLTLYSMVDIDAIRNLSLTRVSYKHIQFESLFSVEIFWLTAYATIRLDVKLQRNLWNHFASNQFTVCHQENK